jgi:hypothetical protein
MEFCRVCFVVCGKAAVMRCEKSPPTPKTLKKTCCELLPFLPHLLCFFALQLH